MWLLFDRSGRLLKQVEYSELAYVTSTNFYLFCVFENVNLDNIGLAHLSLKKPSGDLLNFEIAGTPEVKTFVVPNENLESSYLPFVNGQEYGGVRFDFSETGFLNEVGLWKGTITFYNALLGIRNLTGLFTFMVQKSVVNTQIGPISYDEYLLLLGEIAKKQDHLIAGANITIKNSVISATGGGGGGGDYPDLSNYVTLDELYSYHDDTKQNVISLANKLPIEFIEGDIKTVTKLSELENDVGYATVDWVNSIIPDQYDDTAIKLRLNKIEGVIPAQANELNELADKNFVNSSISTATATFKGTFDNLTELQQTSADLNDYAYFKHTDDNGNTVYSKYKYSDGAWIFEYDLNTTGFTAEQWATINSGLTANSIPTKTSQLTNDSNYLTKTNGDSYYQAKGDYALKSEILTKTSELTNDSNFAKHIYHTTEEWNNLSTFIGEKGTICIWTDYKTYEDNGQTIVEPGIKISNGISPVVDLGFIGSENAKILLEHIEDRTIHIIDKEREKWNNKIEIEAEPTIENETLYLNK